LDIRLFLENGIKHVMNQFQEKDIEISFKMKKNKFYVKAGELLLDAFENILLNAIVHNKKEKIKLWINASKFQKNGNDYIKIEFKDNAIGINDSRKKIIFKKSYKNRESTGGMGIGLSLVKNIIESYNGKIWVEDRIAGKHHEGSNFIILLRKAQTTS
ncbi:MAG: sensor histidine kinase, partial [Promethearchaeia archaeon]